MICQSNLRACEYGLIPSVFQRSWTLYASAEKGQRVFIPSHVTPTSHLGISRCDVGKPHKHWVWHTSHLFMKILSYTRTHAHVYARESFPLKNYFESIKKRLDEVERCTNLVFMRVLGVSPFVTPFYI